MIIFTSIIFKKLLSNHSDNISVLFWITILRNVLPSNLKAVQNVDISETKYSEYLLEQQERDEIHISISYKNVVWFEWQLSGILIIY
jgi:hypothetical protein